MKTTSSFIPYFMAFLLAACGESSFSGDDGRKAPAARSTDNAQPKHEDDLSPDGAGGGESESPSDIFTGDTNSTPPTDCSDEQILVIDLKSGWWAGDGGETFQSFVRDEIEKRSCSGNLIGVEYHHILMASPELKAGSKFYKKDFKTYTQVWLLSGALADSMDIRLNEPNFQDFLQQIKTHKPRLFIGAGFGSADHANELARQILWGTEIFDVEVAHGEILAVRSDNVFVQSYATALATGNLFSGVSGPIADVVKVGRGGNMDPAKTAGADEILPLEGVTSLAQCVTVDQNRTVPCVGVAAYNGFNIVLDSGLARFYAIQTGHEPTKQYFRNIVRALSR